MFISSEEKVTPKLVDYYYRKYRMSKRLREYRKLYDAYLGRYDIYKRIKEKGKPNNKISSNFAKYLTDVFCGFFDGIPLVVSNDNETVDNAIQEFNKLNTTQDLDYELVKTSAIFGTAYELVYQNEDGETRSALVTPLNGFIVFDNTIENKPLFGVRYQIDDNMNMTGEVYTRETIYEIKGTATAIDKMTEVAKNEYYDVNMIEYPFNRERIGLYETQMSQINSYNKTLSDKANDIDYFSDAMLVTINADVPQEADEDYQTAVSRFAENMRDNRFMNIVANYSDDSNKPDIKFLSKPNADGSQENYLNRLKDEIFLTSMVANISDKDFGNATSGKSLRYKLSQMENLAKTVERNITRSLKKRYKLVFSFETNVPRSLSDEWKNINIKFTRNLPVDLLDEAQTLSALDGQVSDETKLSLASFINDPKAEIERMEKENNDKVFDKDLDDE